MSVLAKSGRPAIASAPPVVTDRIPTQLAQADIAIGDMCDLGAGGWFPASSPRQGLRMAADDAQAGTAVTLWNPYTRIRYAANAAVTPGVLLYLDTTTPGALNTTSGAGGIADATTAPVPSEGGTGSLGAGVYTVVYTWKDANGETKASAPASATLGASKLLHIAAVTLPTGATGVNWYMSIAVGSSDLAFIVSNANGNAFDINALPAAGAAQPPTVNTTAPSGSTRPYARALANAKGVFEGVIELL